MEHKLAYFDDLDEIMKLVRQAQEYMKSKGLDQWQDGYPQREIFEDDIRHGFCHLFVDDGELCGAVTLYELKDECYEKIYNGKWLTDGENTAAIHRVMVGNNSRGKGIGRLILSFAESLAKEKGYSSLRIDTHKDNESMCALLEKCGFSYCGVVHMDGPENPRMFRIAYEKLL